MADDLIIGLVLAGGRSSRMGQDKAMLPFGPQSLLAHVVQRLAPQVARIAVSSNAALSDMSVDILPDGDGHLHRGPLAGICAGLAWAREIGAPALATVAVDTPFFPTDLVVRLEHAAAPAAVASSNGRRHPAFAMWPTSALDAVRDGLESDDRSIIACLRDVGFGEVAFDGGAVDPFFNVNTPADYDEARRLLAATAA